LSTTLTSFATIKCDGPGCPNTVTFEQTQDGEREALLNNPWLENLRSVATSDGKGKFGYCSDTCEAKALGEGKHNKSRIITGSDAAAAQAAREQLLARQATSSLKQGTGVTL